MEFYAKTAIFDNFIFIFSEFVHLKCLKLANTNFQSTISNCQRAIFGPLECLDSNFPSYLSVRKIVIIAYLWNNPYFLERIGSFSIVKLELDWSLASKILLYFLPSKPWPQGKGRQEGWLNGLRLNKSQQWRHRPRICLELLRPNFGVAGIFFPIFREVVRLQVDAQDRVMTSNLPPNCLLEVGPLKSEKKLNIF